MGLIGGLRLAAGLRGAVAHGGRKLGAERLHGDPGRHFRMRLCAPLPAPLFKEGWREATGWSRVYDLPIILLVHRAKPDLIQSSLFTPSGGLTLSAGYDLILVSVICPFTSFVVPYAVPCTA